MKPTLTDTLKCLGIFVLIIAVYVLAVNLMIYLIPGD